jgi:hypothetical protein
MALAAALACGGAAGCDYEGADAKARRLRIERETAADEMKMPCRDEVHPEPRRGFACPRPDQRAKIERTGLGGSGTVVVCACVRDGGTP